MTSNLNSNYIIIVGDPFPYRAGEVNMNDVEYKRYRDFLEKHETGCKLIVGFCSIGTKITVRCDKCNVELDISDYDSW